MGMEEIDLSDRRGLIAMAYGSPPEQGKPIDASNTSLAGSQSDKAPLTNSNSSKNQTREVTRSEPREPKKPKRVSCARATCCFLLICAILACLLSALVAYGLTRQHFDQEGHVLPFVPDPRYNLTQEEAQAQEEEDEWEKDSNTPKMAEMRLPTSFIPLWYNVTVQIYLPGFVPIRKEKNLTYDVSMTIKMKALEDTDKIVLNSKDLDLDLNPSSYRLFDDAKRGNKVRRATNATESEAEGFNATEITVMEKLPTTTERSNRIPIRNPIKNETKVEEDLGLKIKAITLNSTLQFVVFHLSEPIKAGKELYLKLAFSAKLRNTMNGLYLTSYKGENDTDRLFVMTHMEPAYARGFVPCFDEPQLKAPWKIKIIHPKGSNAVSNGIEEIEKEPLQDSPDWVSTSFEETLPISSYLVAMSVNDYAYSEARTSNGTRFRFWARPSAINQTEYALDMGTRAIEFFEKYYGMPYPLTKQDMIAIVDFDPGAMENMGLIAYRESYVLYDPKLNTLQNKFKVANTVAHEISHQWLGNLVTMDWWGDLWLNEGTARYFEGKAVDEITNGAYHGDEAFEIFEHNRAFTKDARSSSHPLQLNVSSFDEIKEAFDFITYDKGASFLKMIEKILGEENFEQGLKSYVKKNCYKSTNSTNLFESLNEVVPNELTGWDAKKFDLVDFAAKWTEQMGFPVVEMHRLDNMTIEFTQGRFKRDSVTPEAARYRNARFWYKWDIPLWYSIDGESQPLAWLHEAYRLNITEDKLILVNPDSVGFYRVNYDQRGWDGIQRQLNEDHTKIPVKARHRIIDDAFALAAANLLPYEVAFNVSSYLSKEEETIPWIAAIQGFADVLGSFDDQPDSEGIRDFIRAQLKPLFNKIDFSNLDFVDEKDLMKSLLISAAMKMYCVVQGEECIQKATDLFKKGVTEACSDDQVASECSRVPVLIRDSVYCEGIKWGDAKAFETIRNLTLREQVTTERVTLLGSLGCSRDPFTIKKVLYEAINSTDFRDNEIVQLFMASAYGTVGRYVNNDFIMEHWREIFKREPAWKIGKGCEFRFEDTQFALRNIILYGTRARNERDLREIEYFLSKHRGTTRRFSAWRLTLEQGKSLLNWNKRHRKSLNQFFKGSKNETNEEL